MAEMDAVPFDAPIPGESLTAELGSRPWQSPPQFATVEQALDYYLPQTINQMRYLLSCWMFLRWAFPVTTG